MTQDPFGNQYKGNFQILFSTAAGISEILIKASATEIFGETGDNNAFYNCHTTIKTVNFETNPKLRIIRPYAFYDCAQLTFIDLSVCTELVEIQNDAFHYCRGIETINLPSSLNKILSGAFWASGLKSITIPRSVTKIGDVAFASCKSLTKVIFEPGINLETLEQWTFERTMIESFTVPATTKYITGLVIRPAVNLKSISVEGENYYRIIGGMLCSSNGEDLVICPALYNTVKVTVPNGIKTIKSYSFFSCQSPQIEIPTGVQAIEEYAFSQSLITSIVLPDSVTTVANYLFDKCSRLTAVTLSSTLKSLSDYMLHESGLMSIVIPNSVKDIGAGCFSNCKQLSKVTLPTNLEKFGGGAFSGCSAELKLEFAQGSPFKIDDQKLIMSDNGATASNFIGSTPNSHIIIPNTVTSIATSAFASNQFVEEISFQSPAKITTIWSRAFESCASLIKVTFPDSLERIEANAFQDSGLQSASFGTKLTYVGREAFLRCKDMQSVTFSDGPAVQIIERAFQDCTGLQTLRLGEGLTTILSLIASGTKELHSINIPTTVVSIGERAFYSSGLHEVTFNEGTPQLQTIGTRAFSYCYYLTTFPFVDPLTSVGIMAFYQTSINEIVIPNSLETLSTGCFEDCTNLNSIKLASQDANLSTIDERVFSKCTQLATVDINNANFQTDNNILYDHELTKIILYPAASPTKFVCLPSKVTNIAPYSFSYCSKICSITIPDDSQLNTIGANAFFNCTNIRTINIPEKVENVGQDAFLGCDSLSCGLFILNTNDDFRRSLITLGKMPKRCLDSCIVRISMRNCFTTKISYFSTILIGLILNQ